MSSIEPRDDEAVTIFDVAIVACVVAYLTASIWWAYRASVVWEAFQ